MKSLFILIPIAVVFVSVAVVIFFWAVKSGQFDDLDTEGKRILFDDDIDTNAVDKKKDEVKASDSQHGN